MNLFKKNISKKFVHILEIQKRQSKPPFVKCSSFYRHIRGAVRTKADAIAILHAIRGWVQSFFGCEDCRSHFLEMTGRALPIDEKVTHWNKWKNLKKSEKI